MENELHREPATPEEVWSFLRTSSEKAARETEEIREQMKETDRQMQETDRRMQETDRQMKETDRQMQETDRRQETDRQMKETDRQMQETDRRLKKLDRLFNSQWSKLMESLVEGDLVGLLQAQGIAVERTCTNVKGGRDGRHYEFDILAVNGEEVVVVEVKTTLRAEDVTEFMGKLDKFTDYERVYKGKQVLGAVAYLKADSSVREHAERQGLYVIRATGSSASIINEPGFRPRVFH